MSASSGGCRLICVYVWRKHLTCRVVDDNVGNSTGGALFSIAITHACCCLSFIRTI